MSNLIGCINCKYFRKLKHEINDYCEKFDIGPVILKIDDHPIDKCLTFCSSWKSNDNTLFENKIEDERLYVSSSSKLAKKNLEYAVLYRYDSDKPEEIFENIDL